MRAYLEEGVVDAIAETQVNGREEDGRVEGVDLPRLDESIEEQTADFHVLLLSLRIGHEVWVSGLFSKTFGLVV